MIKDFEYFMPAKLHFGVGKINMIGDIASKYGSKAIIITGQSSSKTNGSLDKVIESLSNKSIKFVVFDKIEPNPRTTTIDEAGDLAKKENCDLVIGLGGGSPMDACKVVALLAKNNCKTWDFVGTSNPPTDALPIICITTTSGTGSEADCYSVVTNPETGEKPGFGFECTMPVESIIDPELSLTVPQRVTASVGIDVFFHAIEAYTSPTANPISDMFAEKAIDLVYNNLYKVYMDCNNLDARYNMAIANTIAGIAIQHAGTGLIHGMAHPISGHYDSYHGEALASVSIAIIKYNFDAEPIKYVKMANLLGSNISNNDPDALNKVIKSLRDFYQPLNLNIDISELGVEKTKIDTLTEDTFKTMYFCVLNNAKIADKQVVKKLYYDSLGMKV